MSGASTAELVESVLTAMKEAAETGEPGSLDALRRASSKEGKAGAPTEPEKPKVPSKGAGTDRVSRPNGEEYFIRKLGPHDDVAVLRDSREKLVFVLAYGPPGTGKTALIEAAYADAAYKPKAGAAKVYTIQGSGDTELADFIGGYIQIAETLEDGTTRTRFAWEDGPLLLAMEEGAVLYVDEIALIDPKVLAGVYGLMDGRGELRVTQNPERGVVTAQPGFYVVAACNPNAPGARMSEALLSRFALQFEITTDYTLAKKMGVPGKVVTAAQNLAKKVEKGEISWAPQLRELLAFKKINDMLGEDTALRNLVSNAPEMDRSTVSDILSRTFSTSIGELRLG